MQALRANRSARLIGLILSLFGFALVARYLYWRRLRKQLEEKLNKDLSPVAANQAGDLAGAMSSTSSQTPGGNSSRRDIGSIGGSSVSSDHTPTFQPLLEEEDHEVSDDQLKSSGSSNISVTRRLLANCERGVSIPPQFGTLGEQEPLQFAPAIALQTHKEADTHPPTPAFTKARPQLTLKLADVNERFPVCLSGASSTADNSSVDDTLSPHAAFTPTMVSFNEHWPHYTVPGLGLGTTGAAGGRGRRRSRDRDRDRDRGVGEGEGEGGESGKASSSYAPSPSAAVCSSTDHPVPINQLYEFRGKLGAGQFAVVREAMNRTTNQRVAIKIIDKGRLLPSQQSRLHAEVQVMRTAQHPHIVKLLDVFETDLHLYIVMELARGGELFDRICERGHFSEKTASRVMQKMVEAVDYLHSLGIIHRDLKPENVLLDSMDDDINIKIADFGLCKIFEKNDELAAPRLTRAKTNVGTPGYQAPEVLERKAYGNECDLWSLGVILYILLCGFPPFQDNDGDPSNQNRLIREATFSFPSPWWDSISDLAKDLVSHLLVKDVTQRYTADQVLNHPWIMGVNTPDMHLSTMIRRAKQFNAQRRLRSIVFASMALSRMSSKSNPSSPAGDPQRPNLASEVSVLNLPKF
eukprot:GILK01010923.1.p1 GENE.GILK01010923.1~~GILK01010923.1.p1  ORF type:complete len:658 (+),score=75.11 GILK01010923.1:67-1974(+)